jgi:tRNA(Ile)-lysidine synthase
MEILGADSECLDGMARAWIGGEPRVPFEGLAVAIQRRVLQSGLVALGADPEFELIEKLRTGSGRPVTVSSELTVRHDGRGRVRRVEPGAVDFGEGLAGLELAGRKGRGRFGDLEWHWQIRGSRKARLPKFAAGSEWFDADKVGAWVVLRHWRPGDRFHPIGLAAPAKLQDLFVNAKIPRAQRHERIVATTAAGDIWWVEGLRIGERFKLCPETRRRLKWSWRRVGRPPVTAIQFQKASSPADNRNRNGRSAGR